MTTRIMKLLTIGSATIVATIAVPALAKPLSVNIVGESPATYQCNDGSKIIANYYQLSDKSLQFVKLKLKDQELTLPQAMSASGARYSDGYKYEWWIKGNSATFNQDMSDQALKSVECKLARSPSAGALLKK